jgi:hypothetical protein
MALSRPACTQAPTPTTCSGERPLAPAGRLIVAVDHPFAVQAIKLGAGRKDNYLATYGWTEEWIMGG